MNLESRVALFQSRLRSFAFGDELDRAADELLKMLAKYRKGRADIDKREELKALSLVAEYLDAMGRSAEGARLLRPTAEELIEGSAGWSRQMDEASDKDAARRLMRQRVWCVLAYALTHLRANRLREAGAAIARMREFVDRRLVSEDFPCHGTRALTRYYEGLWKRNRGLLNEAAWDFDAAMEHVRLRLEDKQRKYEGADAERLRREVIYARVSTARILGFGLGGISLSRGRYVEARAWMSAAQQILAQLGQEVWRRGLEVYGRSATVLVQELDRLSEAGLRKNALRLSELARWFEGRNRRNTFIAEAFAIVAEVRVRQIGSGLTVDLRGLRQRLERCLKLAYLDEGPLSATAALQLIECLLRAKDFRRCGEELERFRRELGREEEQVAEFQVLEAELAMETGRVGVARARLLELVAQRPANRAFRARAWALLAVCEMRQGERVWAERAIAASRESLEHVQDGFTKAMVAEIASRIETAAPAPKGMPYQEPSDDERWCDLDYNLEVARLNIVEAVYLRHPDYGVEKLAAAMGRGHSWLYGFLAKHREVEWVAGVLGR